MDNSAYFERISRLLEISLSGGPPRGGRRVLYELYEWLVGGEREDREGCMYGDNPFPSPPSPLRAWPNTTYIGPGGSH